MAYNIYASEMPFRSYRTPFLIHTYTYIYILVYKHTYTNTHTNNDIFSHCMCLKTKHRQKHLFYYFRILMKSVRDHNRNEFFPKKNIYIFTLFCFWISSNENTLTFSVFKLKICKYLKKNWPTSVNCPYGLLKRFRFSIE